MWATQICRLHFQTLIKVPEHSESKQFFAEIRFTSAQGALDFFKESFENPKKGIRVEPAQNKMETAKHLTLEETQNLIEKGDLIVGVLRYFKAC